MTVQTVASGARSHPVRAVGGSSAVLFQPLHGSATVLRRHRKPRGHGCDWDGVKSVQLWDRPPRDNNTSRCVPTIIGIHNNNFQDNFRPESPAMIDASEGSGSMPLYKPDSLRLIGQTMKENFQQKTCRALRLPRAT
jgi:hypothetical protein